MTQDNMEHQKCENQELLDAFRERLRKIKRTPDFLESYIVATHLMFEMTRGIEAMKERNMQKEGLPGPAWLVLVMAYSAEDEKLIASDICSVLSQNKSTTSRIVDVLIEKSFLKREYDTEDRRKIYLYITEEGKQFVDRKMPENATQFSAIWGDIDTDQLIPLMLKALNNLKNIKE